MPNTAALILEALTVSAGATQWPVQTVTMDTTVTTSTTMDAVRQLDVLMATSVTTSTTMTAAKELLAEMSTIVVTSTTMSTVAEVFVTMETIVVTNTDEPLWLTGGAAWAVNLDSSASSYFENFAFNSFAKIGDKYIGAQADGLYILDGATDDGDPIRASINFGRLRFNSDNWKSMYTAYMAGLCDDTMYLKISYVDTSGDAQEYVYSARRSDDVERTQRFDVGRGITAHSMMLELFNNEGCDFELRSFSALATDKTRRI